MLPLSASDNLIRVAINDRNEDMIQDTAGVIEQALATRNIAVRATYRTTEIQNAIADHMKVLVVSLLAIAVMMAGVGIIGLA